MKMKMKMNVEMIAFDGEEDQNNDENKKFTQEEVNAILAKEKRRTREAQEQLLSQLEEEKKRAKSGSEEKTTLEKKIEELQKITMSAEERARQKEEKIKKTYDEQVSSLAQEKETWQRRHADVVISNSILQAASANKAVSPNQIMKMIRSDVKLVNKVDEEGKPIDAFEARMDFEDLDKNNKPITLNLTVEEAVKRMRELPQYGNLFEGGKTGGIGDTNAGGSGRGLDLAKVAQQDPAAYRKLRKEHPELLEKLG